MAAAWAIHHVQGVEYDEIHVLTDIKFVMTVSLPLVCEFLSLVCVGFTVLNYISVRNHC